MRRSLPLAALLLGATLATHLPVGAALATHQHFLEEPTDITAVAGQQVELPCSVQYKEGLLQWTKNGFGLGVSRDLPGYPGYSMAGQDPVLQWNLVLDSVGLQDDGVYQCQVGAAADNEPIRSVAASLTVLVPPGQPGLVRGRGEGPGQARLEVEGEEGEELLLTCTSEGGRPAGEITWRDEAGHLVLTDTDTSTHKMGDKSWRTVSRIRLRLGFDDRDRAILCHVTSHISPEPLEARARVRVRHRPRVNLGVGDPAVEGGNLALHCHAEAHPPATVFAWYLDKLLIPGANSDSLILEELTRVNEGAKLECEATNPEGTGRAETLLRVHYGAEIKEVPRTVRAKAGELVSFQCKADSNPAPTYKWTRVGSELSVGSSEILTLVSSNMTMGQYVCHALVSGFPSASSPPASLYLVTTPLILSPKVQTGRLGGPARLECRVATTGSNNLITWDRGGAVLSGQEPGLRMTFSEAETEQVSELFIEEAGSEDFAVYGCKAANEVGVVYKMLRLQQEGSWLGSNEILYIMLGVSSLATIILLGFLCVVLYKRRKRSNLKYLRAAKQEQVSRERKAESPDNAEAGQLTCPQPDLIQPLKRDLPSNWSRNDPDESDDNEVQVREKFYYSPQKKPFAIDRFLQSPSTPLPAATEATTILLSDSSGAYGDWQVPGAVQCSVAGKRGLEDEDQFLMLLPTAQAFV